MTQHPSAPTPGRAFIPAKPSRWLLALVQTVVKYYLRSTNTVHIRDDELSILRNLPEDCGVILTPNHADEVDPSLCLDVARRCGRRFIFMGNREAFDEYLGLGGWLLQRLGLFSVERGGHDTPAKQYATDVVKAARDILVIFPEGEIYYLNEKVQPFHSGAVDIGMRALIERRQTDPNWTACVVPMAIRYSYAVPMNKVLEKRVQQMEKHLQVNRRGHELRKRLASLLADVLKREEIRYNIEQEAERFEQLGERITHARHAILAQVEQKYTSAFSDQARTIDRAFQLSAHVRELLAQKPGPELEQIYRRDLTMLKEVAHMVSWQPQYIDDDSEFSTDRLAEVVLKLERELYGIKRPPQLAKRKVYLRVGKPVDLADFLHEYHEDAYVVRRRVTEQLRQTIQGLIDNAIPAADSTN